MQLGFQRWIQNQVHLAGIPILILVGWSTDDPDDSQNELSLWELKGQQFDLGCHFGTDFFFVFFRAALSVYGGSQARDPVGAVATGLCHSQSNAGSELHL